MSISAELFEIEQSVRELQHSVATGTDLRDQVIDAMARVNSAIPEARKSTNQPEVVDSAVVALKEAANKLFAMSQADRSDAVWDDLFHKAADRIQTASQQLARAD